MGFTEEEYQQLLRNQRGGDATSRDQESHIPARLNAAVSRTSGTAVKRSKYGARKKEIDGIVFDSSAEAKRYLELTALQAAGEIYALSLQPRFLLQNAFRDAEGKLRRKVEYVADFRYLMPTGFSVREIAEDVKGHPTAVYKMKIKMAIAKYPQVRFREVR